MSERNFRGGGRQRWADEEVLFVMSNADHMSDSELAAELTRITGRKITQIAVKEVREMELGIRKDHRGIRGDRFSYIRPR